MSSPITLTFSNPTSTGITVTWDQNYGDMRDIIITTRFSFMSDRPNYTIPGSNGVVTGSYTFTTLEPDATYTIVTISDSNGGSVEPMDQTFTTGQTVFQFTPYATSVIVSWDNSYSGTYVDDAGTQTGTITPQDIQLTLNGTGYQLTGSGTQSSGSFTIDGLEPNTTYTMTDYTNSYGALETLTSPLPFTTTSQAIVSFTNVTSSSVDFNWIHFAPPVVVYIQLEPFYTAYVGYGTDPGTYTLTGLQPYTRYKVYRITINGTTINFRDYQKNQFEFTTLSTDGSYVILSTNKNALTIEPSLNSPEPSLTYVNGYFYGQSTNHTVYTLTTDPMISRGVAPRGKLWVAPFIECDRTQSLEYVLNCINQSYSVSGHFVIPQGIYVYETLFQYIRSQFTTFRIQLTRKVPMNHLEIQVYSYSDVYVPTGSYIKGHNGLGQILGIGDGPYTPSTPLLLTKNTDWSTPTSLSCCGRTDTTVVSFVYNPDDQYVYQYTGYTFTRKTNDVMNVTALATDSTGTKVYIFNNTQNVYLYPDASMINFGDGTTISCGFYGKNPTNPSESCLFVYDSTNNQFLYYTGTVNVYNTSPLPSIVPTQIVYTDTVGYIFLTNDGNVWIDDLKGNAYNPISFSGYTIYNIAYDTITSSLLFCINNTVYRLYEVQLTLGITYSVPRALPKPLYSSHSSFSISSATNYIFIIGHDGIINVNTGLRHNVTPQSLLPRYAPSGSDTFLLNGSQGIEFYFHNLGFPLRKNYSYTFTPPSGYYSLPSLLDTLKRGIEGTLLTYTNPRVRQHHVVRTMRRRHRHFNRQRRSRVNPYEPINYTVHVGISQDGKSQWAIEPHGTRSLYDSSRSFIRGLDTILGFQGDFVPNEYFNQTVFVKNSVFSGQSCTQGPDGTVYASSNNGYIYTSTLVLIAKIGVPVTSMAVLNGILYYITGDYLVYGIVLSDGSFIPPLRLGSPPTFTRQTNAHKIISDGFNLYITYVLRNHGSYTTFVVKYVTYVTNVFGVGGRVSSMTYADGNAYLFMDDDRTTLVTWNSTDGLNNVILPTFYDTPLRRTQGAHTIYPNSLAYYNGTLVYGYQLGYGYYVDTIDPVSGGMTHVTHNGVLGTGEGIILTLEPTYDQTTFFIYTGQGYICRYSPLPSTIPYATSPNKMVSHFAPTVITTLPTRVYIVSNSDSFVYSTKFMYDFKPKSVWKRMIQMEKVNITWTGSVTGTLQILSPTLKSYYNDTGILHSEYVNSVSSVSTSYQIEETTLGYPVPGQLTLPDTFQVQVNYVDPSGVTLTLPVTYISLTLVIYEYAG